MSLSRRDVEALVNLTGEEANLCEEMGVDWAACSADLARALLALDKAAREARPSLENLMQFVTDADREEFPAVIERAERAVELLRAKLLREEEDHD